MAVVHLSPASEERRTQATHPVCVCLTPTVQRDYLRRGVFPYFRISNAQKARGAGAAVFWASTQEARALLEDARAARKRADESPRGTAKAFGSLTAALKAQLDAEARRGLWIDPGRVEAHARAVRASALFAVGDKVLYFSDGDDKGRAATIVCAYQAALSVAEDTGPYIDEKGRRASR